LQIFDQATLPLEIKRERTKNNYTFHFSLTSLFHFCPSRSEKFHPLIFFLPIFLSFFFFYQNKARKIDKIDTAQSIIDPFTGAAVDRPPGGVW
jgi:hypothetical protein